MKSMILRLIVGAVVGGGLGFAYHKFASCSTGACPLTRNPYIASLYGLIVGALVATQLN